MKTWTTANVMNGRELFRFLDESEVSVMAAVASASTGMAIWTILINQPNFVVLACHRRLWFAWRN